MRCAVDIGAHQSLQTEEGMRKEQENVSCTVSAGLTDDPRGIRFVAPVAPVREEQEIEVVCRFLPSGLLRIITIYALEN